MLDQRTVASPAREVLIFTVSDVAGDFADAKQIRMRASPDVFVGQAVKRLAEFPMCGIQRFDQHFQINRHEAIMAHGDLFATTAKCILPSGSAPMTKSITEFANEWIACWNSRDLDRILSHYANDIVFTSPKALARMPHTQGTVRGINQLREYWAPLNEIRPNLKFTLESVLETVNGCTILYRDENNLLVAETMMFNANGKIVQGIVSHIIT